MTRARPLADFVAAHMTRGLGTSVIADLAIEHGVTRSRKAVAAAVCAAKKAAGHATRAPAREALPARVNGYLEVVAREYRVSVAQLRERFLTAICDDDLAKAILGDPPPRRPVGRPRKGEA